MNISVLQASYQIIEANISNKKERKGENRLQNSNDKHLFEINYDVEV